MPRKVSCKICNNPVAKIIKLLNVIIVNSHFTSHSIKLTLKLTSTSQKKAAPDIVFLPQVKIFPFSNFNEDNFHKTVHGKKVKFLTIKKTKTNKYLLKN